jgi:multiple sugar transport system permease protein
MTNLPAQDQLQPQPELSRTARVISRTKKVLLYAILIAVVVVYTLPGIGVVLTSFKTDTEIAMEGLWALPHALRIDNYVAAWTSGDVAIYTRNSFLVTLPATFFSIFLGILTGYVFSKLSFRGSELLFIFVIAGLFFPPQIVLIPLFRLFNQVKLYDTLWPMIIVHTAFGLPICTLIMRNYFATIPLAIREAAIIDGANELEVLAKVMLPVSLPAVAVLVTLQFTWIWNDFLYPIIFTRSVGARTIMVGLISLQGQYSVAWGEQGAMAVIASIPTLIVFIFFQRYFIKGLTMGSVKG